jgi:plastocyanin
MKLTMRAPLMTLVLVMAGCLPRVGPELTDGGDETDGGQHTHDAGAQCTNGQRDGDESDVDCGGTCPACALTALCGSPRDCLSGVCTGRCVAPANPCPAAFSGCTSFVDLTTSTAPTITFPVGGNRYSPDCVRVRLGQSVLFTGGDFNVHELAQACGPVSNVVRASSGTSATINFSVGLGLYGFYCTQHGSASGSGMAGAIEVVP